MSIHQNFPDSGDPHELAEHCKRIGDLGVVDQDTVMDTADLDHLLFPVGNVVDLDSDADTIIAMWMNDDSVSDCAIAKALGRSQHTFADQMRKYRTELRRIRGY